MKQKLIDAAMSSLVDLGYARTSAVEVCRRAGVTRGALFHHYDSLPALLADALEVRFCDMFTPLRLEGGDDDLAQWLTRFWQRIATPHFKAVIEIWFAARNDPDATWELQGAIDRISVLINPRNNPQIQDRLANDADAVGFYHTAIEAMFGLLLGRATSADDKPLAHEDLVISYLLAQAKQF